MNLGDIFLIFYQFDLYILLYKICYFYVLFMKILFERFFQDSERGFIKQKRDRSNTRRVSETHTYVFFIFRAFIHPPQLLYQFMRSKTGEIKIMYESYHAYIFWTCFAALAVVAATLARILFRLSYHKGWELIGEEDKKPRHYETWSEWFVTMGKWCKAQWQISGVIGVAHLILFYILFFRNPY